MNRLLRSLPIVMSALALTACSLLSDEEEIAQEDRPAETIFSQGEARLNSGSPLIAAREFEDVERLYPYSPWAKRAMIMGAYAYYQGQQYDQAALTAQRYLDFYPSDKDAAYAQYLIGLSYYDQIVDVGRDQGNTREALRALRETTERYPDSDYARLAKLKLDLTLDHLAGKEMEVGRYYLKRSQPVGAINRFKVVIERYQTTSHTPEALHRLVEAYLQLGVPGEAQTAAAVLGHNFPGSDWYAYSYGLLTGENLVPREDQGSFISQVFRRVIKGQWY